MIQKLLYALLFALLGILPSHAEEGTVRLDVRYPYVLSASENAEVHPGSTQMLYVCLENFNAPSEEAELRVTLPPGLKALPGKGLTVEDEGRQVDIHWTLPDWYGQTFDTIQVVSEDSLSGDIPLQVRAWGNGFDLSESLSFTVGNGENKEREKQKGGAKESWYIQGTALPVNESGERDGRMEKGTLVVPDVILENMKSRLTGGSSADWTGILSKPIAYLLLDMRNPQRDERTIHFKAELVDRGSGETKPGLISFSGEEGGAPDRDKVGSESVFPLNGNKMQTVVLPLYADPFSMTEGGYNLRITLSDGEKDRITEVPLTVVKSRSIGLISLGFSLFCLFLVLLFSRKIKRTVITVGAKGDIAIALFAAMAFGGVVVPVTLLGDFLHVLMGPFSGLVTGLLSGVVQYLLLVSLLILFRKPGVAALFYLIRWLLSAVLFGRVTPVGILLCALSVVVIESVLYLSGFYKGKTVSFARAAAVSLLLGLSDAGMTLINMEQLMLFYRMYYADWFIGLYMVINGLLYSSIGSFLGWKTGARLKQVMGS